MEKDWEEELTAAAEKLSHTLTEKSIGSLVLAESCTGGRTAAALVEIPGASNWLCGSLVVYRSLTKQHWMGISPDLIDQFSTESPEVTAGLCQAALKRTPEASISGAITGHLNHDKNRTHAGPHVYLSAMLRQQKPITSAIIPLQAETRRLRQAESACHLLRWIAQTIKH